MSRIRPPQSLEREPALPPRLDVLLRLCVTSLVLVVEQRRFVCGLLRCLAGRITGGSGEQRCQVGIIVRLGEEGEDVLVGPIEPARLASEHVEDPRDLRELIPVLVIHHIVNRHLVHMHALLDPKLGLRCERICQAAQIRVRLGIALTMTTSKAASSTLVTLAWRMTRPYLSVRSWMSIHRWRWIDCSSASLALSTNSARIHHDGHSRFFMLHCWAHLATWSLSMWNLTSLGLADVSGVYTCDVRLVSTASSMR
jgi:hypothetical protein